MNRLSAFGIAFLMLATAMVSMAPSAMAAPPVPWTGTLSEQIYAVNVGASGGTSCGTPTAGVSITQGKNYLIIIGANVGNQNQIVSGSITGQYFNAQQTPALTGVNAQSGATLVRFDGSGGKAWYVYFTAVNTETITYTCTLNGYQTNWNGPGGITDTDAICKAIPGCITRLIVSGTAPVGFLIDADIAPQTENGVLSTQTQKTPSGSKFTWTRLNQAQTLVNVNAGGGNGGGMQAAQSFTHSTTLGKYLELSSFGISIFNGACSGSLTVSVGKTLSTPWTVADEIGNITQSYTVSPGGGSGIVTVDWINGQISDDAGAFQVTGSPSYSLGGNPVSDLSAFAPFINQTLYFRVFITSAQANCIQTRYTTSDAYGGGNLNTFDGVSWTARAGDMELLNLKVYGGNIMEFRLNATQQAIGGASYTYIAEHQLDSDTGKPLPVSSWGGSPLFGNTLFELVGGAGSPECAFGGVNRQCLIREYRLGYETIPLNATKTFTITVDTTASARNPIYTGTLINQPTITHVSKVSYDNQAGTNPDMVVYPMITSDDYQFTVHVRVVECDTLDGAGQCASPTPTTGFASATVIPNGSYSGFVRGLRALSGNWNATGQFNFSGQDVGGGVTTLTFAASGYTTETGVQINIPSTSGAYFVNVTMSKSTGGGLTVTTSGVSVTFSPSNPSYTTGQKVSINVTRNKPIELHVGMFKLDSIGNPQSVTTLYTWTATDNATIVVDYPNGRNLGLTDSGKYILAVFLASGENVQGKVVGHTKIGVNEGSDFTVTLSFLTDLNTIGQQTISAQTVTAATLQQKETTTYEGYLAALNWAFERPMFGIPNMVFYLTGFLAFAMVLRFYGGRRGGE